MASVASPNEHYITAGYTFSIDMADFMDPNKYKVTKPICRTEWHKDFSTDDVAVQAHPVAIIIGGRARNGAIQFTFRYIDGDSWVLCDDIDMLEKKLGIEVGQLGYIPHHVTERTDKSALFHLSQLSDAISIDLRFELPNEFDESEYCPCGCLLGYKCEQNWINCDKCGLWWHEGCCKQDVTSEFYKCDICCDTNWSPNGPFDVLTTEYFNKRLTQTIYDTVRSEDPDDVALGDSAVALDDLPSERSARYPLTRTMAWDHLSVVQGV